MTKEQANCGPIVHCQQESSSSLKRLKLAIRCNYSVAFMHDRQRGCVIDVVGVTEVIFGVIVTDVVVGVVLSDVAIRVVVSDVVFSVIITVVVGVGVVVVGAAL